MIKDFARLVMYINILFERLLNLIEILQTFIKISPILDMVITPLLYVLFSIINLNLNVNHIYLDEILGNYLQVRDYYSHHWFTFIVISYRSFNI